MANAQQQQSSVRGTTLEQASPLPTAEAPVEAADAIVHRFLSPEALKALKRAAEEAKQEERLQRDIRRHPWKRDFLSRCEGLALLPIGGRKIPVDPETGGGLTGWPHQAFTIEELSKPNGWVEALGYRPGPDSGHIICLDADGATTGAWLKERGLQPKDAGWRTMRGGVDRLKVHFRLTKEQRDQLPIGKFVLTLKEHGGKGGDKGEQLELFNGSGQCVIAGRHPSGALYTNIGSPETVTAPNDAWMAALQEIVAKGTKPKQGEGQEPDESFQSGPDRPCPVCRRDTTGACTIWISEEEDGSTRRGVNCFHGQTFSPPTRIGLAALFKGERPLQRGDEITGADGEQWVFSHKGATGFGTFSCFIKDRPLTKAAKPPASADTSAAPEAPLRKTNPSSPPPPLAWSDLIGLTLEAVKVGDVDAEMELRAEIAGRFRRNDAQVDAALFRLLTEQEAGPKKTALAESVDLRTVQGLDYLVEGFLPANGLALSYGAKGAGKTTAAVALGFSVVDGRGFLDHSKPAAAGKVLFIASDSGAGPLRTVIQEMGNGDHEALIPGEGQRFFVWAHEADQGHAAWDVSVRGCVKLLQFVKEKEISLVVIDSAKAVCAKAGLSYKDNDAVNALLTFMKEVLAPHASVLFLSHDGTAVGSHAGAKAWAEIVDVVHRQTRPEGEHRSRTWTVVKNRLGPTREFSYALEEGELVLAHGVETIGDATAAVLKVLHDAHEKGGKDRLSRKGIHEEVIKRFEYAPKTIDNTLQRLVQGKAPKVVRKGKGFYALSPKERYRGCLVEGEEWHQIPFPAIDLPITQALPEGYSVGNGGRSTDWHALPEEESVGNGRVVGTSPPPKGKTSDSSPIEGVTNLRDAFDEAFENGEW